MTSHPCFVAALALRLTAIFETPRCRASSVAVTRAVVEAGKLLDVSVLDHLVIGAIGRWTSLKERGLGFS